MAYTAPRTDENLANMMTCQKAMSQKLHYVFGEDENSFQVHDGEMHPTFGAKAKPSIGLCIHRGKVVCVKYCPDQNDGQTPSGQKISAKDRMTFPMCHNSMENDYEGIQGPNDLPYVSQQHGK